MQDKTNVMRLLDSKKVWYRALYYSNSISGVDVAHELGNNPKQTFKTLVTVSNTNEHFVFVVPVEFELDLKKAAKAVGVKSISMIKQKELLPLTGYIHGGCSPFGMKKYFKTVIDKSATEYETIFVSAGKVGYQVEVKTEEISKIIRVEFEEII